MDLSTARTKSRISYGKWIAQHTLPGEQPNKIITFGPNENYNNLYLYYPYYQYLPILYLIFMTYYNID